MLKEKIYLSLKEFKVGSFLVVLFLGLCSCQSLSDISQEECPNIPSGRLTNPERINIDGQTVQKTGRISSDNDIGYFFQGKQGQRLSYSSNDNNELCVWVYTPDNKIFSGVELPVNGTYAIHLASLEKTTTFDLKMKLSAPKKETTKVVNKRTNKPLDRKSSQKSTSSSCSNVEIPTYAKAKGLDLVKSFQTNNFRIFIYSKNEKLYYHGIKKTENRDSIFLSANYQQGVGYVAVNQQYKYIINKFYLSVYKGVGVRRSFTFLEVGSGTQARGFCLKKWATF